MTALLRFLKRFQHLAFFILLESVAIAVYLQSDYLLKARAGFWLKEAEAFVEEQLTALSSYVGLRDQNERLVAENLALRNELEHRRIIVDVLHEAKLDSLYATQYKYYGGTVVSNSVVNQHNYFAINVGSKQGIMPSMPVLADGSVAGMVLTTSRHYSIVISLLNTDMRLSAKLKRTGYFGSLRWDGIGYQTALLSDIPHHVDVRKGDTVVTTGYSNIFPADLFVGIVDNVEVKGGDFNIVRVKLGCDFKRLHYVTLISDSLRRERDSVEQILRSTDE
jgi:putative rod shape-determining protein